MDQKSDIECNLLILLIYLFKRWHNFKMLFGRQFYNQSLKQWQRCRVQDAQIFAPDWDNLGLGSIRIRFWLSCPQSSLHLRARLGTCHLVRSSTALLRQHLFRLGRARLSQPAHTGVSLIWTQLHSSFPWALWDIGGLGYGPDLPENTCVTSRHHRAPVTRAVQQQLPLPSSLIWLKST